MEDAVKSYSLTHDEIVKYCEKIVIRLQRFAKTYIMLAWNHMYPSTVVSQYVDKMKRQQTETSKTQNVDKPNVLTSYHANVERLF